MTADDSPRSLVEQAAAWVPPWARTPRPSSDPEVADDGGPPAEDRDSGTESAVEPHAARTDRDRASAAGGDADSAAEIDTATTDVGSGDDTVEFGTDGAVDVGAVGSGDGAADIDAGDDAADIDAAAGAADIDAAGTADPGADIGASGAMADDADGWEPTPDAADGTGTVAADEDRGSGTAGVIHSHLPHADRDLDPNAAYLGEAATPHRDTEPDNDRRETDATVPAQADDPAEGQEGVVDRSGEPIRELQLIPDAELRGALEAILLVVDEPVSEVLLAQVLEQPTERVTTILAALTESYSDADRGFELRRAAGGWRLYTRPRYAPYVEKFVLDGQQARLTQAALETLAVVAYKQPVTRSRISAIRGVNCDGVVRTLVTRGLIEECGSEPDSGAFLYRTTTLFLEKLGLDSVAQLPALAPFLPDDVDEIADAQR